MTGLYSNTWGMQPQTEPSETSKQRKTSSWVVFLWCLSEQCEGIHLHTMFVLCCCAKLPDIPLTGEITSAQIQGFHLGRQSAMVDSMAELPMQWLHGSKQRQEWIRDDYRPSKQALRYQFLQPSTTTDVSSASNNTIKYDSNRERTKSEPSWPNHFPKPIRWQCSFWHKSFGKTLCT